MDVNFIMELGQEGRNVGGNGFGSVTCEYLLSFPPSLPFLSNIVHMLNM